eukprot:2634049-Prymnesium_polylepis.1
MCWCGRVAGAAADTCRPTRAHRSVTSALLPPPPPACSPPPTSAAQSSLSSSCTRCNIACLLVSCTSPARKNSSRIMQTIMHSLPQRRRSGATVMGEGALGERSASVKGWGSVCAIGGLAAGWAHLVEVEHKIELAHVAEELGQGGTGALGGGTGTVAAGVPLYAPRILPRNR